MKALLLFLSFVVFVFANGLGFIDDITINGREFDSLEDTTIEFYSDDLQDGQITISGILESSEESIPVDDLSVEISIDGGNSWHKVNGHDEWEWSFTPELEHTYQFTTRVVRDTQDTTLPTSLTIAGFTLSLDSNTSISNGKLSGSGTINIPYLSTISSDFTENSIHVSFSNLSISGTSISSGDITFEHSFTILTPIADIHVNRLTFSPIASNNKIDGNIEFKEMLASSFGTINLPNENNSFSPNSINIAIPITSKTINIWEEQGVMLDITSGSLNVGYTTGEGISANFDIPQVEFKLGDLLKYTDTGNGAAVNTAFSSNISITLPKETTLLDTGIKIPSGTSISLNMSDYNNPQLSFTSSVNLQDYSIDILKNLNNATINAEASKTGFSATITGGGQLSAITILDRGNEADDVRLAFEGDNPEITIGVSNSEGPTFAVSGITPKIHFGNLLKNATNGAQDIVANLSDLTSKTQNISITQSLKLLGSNIKLPNGFNATVNLEDLSSPQISFNTTVDFSEYDNIVAKSITSATIEASISTSGFSATVTADKPSPIMIYSGKDVKLIFQGDSGPSFSINVSGTDSLPQFHISSIQAKLDFGSLLRAVGNEADDFLADVSTQTQDGLEVLQLTLPNVKIPDSNLVFEGIVAHLNLGEKQISLSGSVDLSGYGDNPILNAITGSSFSASVSSSGFNGSITMDEELDPIDIWAEKNVKLTVNGTPTVSISLGSSGVDFDFGTLNASIDFGDLLKDVSSHTVSAALGSTQNSSGEYTLTIPNTVKLLDSSFQLSNTTVGLNIKNKSLSLSSSVDLSAYNNPVLDAFNGATFNANISTAGFSGTLTKSGEIDPIVIYAEKNVKLNFTESPTIGITIANSGIKFDFDGGNANLNFGDLLNNIDTTLASVENQKGVYSWEIDGEIPLGGTSARIKSITNGRLDISDISNPQISFDASIDLSGYGGVLANVTDAQLQNTTISKSGFSTSASVNLGNVDVWADKNVKLIFASDSPPTINLSIGSGGNHISFSNLTANLDFGDLLPPDSIATISNITQPGEEETSSGSYSWTLDGSKKLFNKDIYVSNLGGTIDLSDFSNPLITLSAMVDFSQYDNPIFEHITNAELSDVSISKSGFSGTLATTMSDITIWSEKDVKVIFDENNPPTFTMSIDAGGLKLGAQNMTASLNLGSLLNNSTGSLESIGNHVYSWSIEGSNQLGETGVLLSGLNGTMDFSDLKDPSVSLNATANISSLGSNFNNVSLQNGLISKSGFSAEISATIDDISIYHEETKEIKLKFADNSTPTLSLSLDRTDGLNIGISDLQANFKFTNILNNQLVNLTPVMIDGKKQKGVFAWQIDGNQTFLNDSKGVLSVNNLGGVIDLNNWSDPKVSFHTTADFNNYNLIPNVNLGTVEVTNASIKKTKIEWNLEISGASANFTILDLGDGPDDDVRIALENISASVGSDGTSFGGGDGSLYLGKLFDGNKQASLTSSSSGGLKSYTFSFSEDVVYRQDDENYITFKNLSGTVSEQSGGGYKVSLGGEAIVHSSVLNAVNVGELTLSNLEIDNTGLKGVLTASWQNNRISILEGQAALILSEVGVSIDTSKSMPIALSNFGGKLDLGNFFEGTDTPQANLTFADSSIKWGTGDKAFTLKGSPKYIFQNLDGTLSFASLNTLSVGFSGVFKYQDLDNNITLSDFVIDSSGVSGTATLGGAVEIIPDLQLTQFSIAFAGINTSGSASLTYNNSSFLGTGEPFTLGLSATADRTGLTEFSVNTTGNNTPQSIDINGFAKLSFTDVTVNPDIKNFWISLNGTVKPQNSKFNSSVSVGFSGLKISKDGISIDSAEANTQVSGGSAKLGPMTVNVKSVGLGFDVANNNSRLYINFSGGASLDIAQADANITIYSDKSIKVHKIGVDIHQSGLKAKGNLEWFSDDSVYGDGFKATIDKIYLADIVEAGGLLQIGQIGSTFYWQGAVDAGLGATGIPLGTSGLSMFTAGGGIAYNMSYNAESKKFIPSNGSVGLVLSTNIGTTSDKGLLWNGDIKMIASVNSGTLQNLSMNGTSWIFSKTREERPDKRKIIANITYGADPKSLQIYASANVEYKLIKVAGQMDIMVSSYEKHVFIGTDSDYAFRFNITNELGHVKVTAFGRDLNGFFMGDEDSIAFGAGVSISKTWKKKWTGPDPKVELKLNADAKALIMYKPEFQFNSDVNLEVVLKACYGGCLSASSDVLLKFATPNPKYIYGEVTFSFPKKDIKFSRYIYGEGELQESEDEPNIDLLDHVEPSEQPVGRMPIFKVYTSFMKSQPVTVQITDVKLLKDSNQNSSSSSSWADKVQEAANSATSSGSSTNQSISLNAYNLDADDPRQGVIYLPSALLDKHTWYKLRGQITMSYEEDGVTETLTRSFYKRFKTRNDNGIRFSDFVNSITPLNDEKNVQEDEGVKIHYNKILISKLPGGTNNNYIKEYRIELYDSDYNRIYGTFTQANNDNNFVAKFKPSKDLRIYRYCVNQKGEIMETFLDNEGHFLNPFNGYTVDVGGAGSQRNYLQSQAATNANVKVNIPGTQKGAVKLLNSSSQSSSTYATSSLGSGNMNSIAGSTQHNTYANVPSYIRKGLIVLKTPDALGSFVMSSRDSNGKLYSYYRANRYQIIVRHLPTNSVVHNSHFEVRYNNVPAEAKRKVEQMQANLDPTLTVSFDVHRLTESSVSRHSKDRSSTSAKNSKNSSSNDTSYSMGIHSAHSNSLKSPNGDFYNQVRLVVDNGLEGIGVNDGVTTKITINWNILKEDGTSKTIKQIWNTNSNEIFLPGVVVGYDASIKYLSQIDGSLILKVPMRLISGTPFNSAKEKREDIKNYHDDIAQNMLPINGSGSSSNLGGFGGSSEPVVPVVKQNGTSYDIFY